MFDGIHGGGAHEECENGTHQNFLWRQTKCRDSVSSQIICRGTASSYSTSSASRVRSLRRAFRNRHNPEFSRLSALLSFEEAKLLDNVSTIVGADINMLIFDGLYIKCLSLETGILILEACASCAACKEAVIPLEVKSWPGTLPLVLPRLALRSGLAVVRPDETLVRAYPNCLVNVIASLSLACDVSSFVDFDDALSVGSFNATIVHFLVKNHG